MNTNTTLSVRLSTNKDNPCSYADMISYLSELSGISINKEVEMKNVWKKIKKRNGTVKLKLKDGLRGDSIVVVDKEGNRFAYMQAGPQRFDQCGIVAEKFICTVQRAAAEFGIPIKPAGTYKEWEGMGYFNSPVSEVNGFFFHY